MCDISDQSFIEAKRGEGEGELEGCEDKNLIQNKKSNKSLLNRITSLKREWYKTSTKCILFKVDNVSAISPTDNPQ